MFVIKVRKEKKRKQSKGICFNGLNASKQKMVTILTIWGIRDSRAIIACLSVLPFTHHSLVFTQSFFLEQIKKQNIISMGDKLSYRRVRVILGKEGLVVKIGVSGG